jgi:hypothetical protein
MEAALIETLVQLGFDGILVYFISQLWAEIRDTNRYLRELALKQLTAEDERRELMEKVESLEAYRVASLSRRQGGGNAANN